MAFNLNAPSLYVKGTADIWVFNPVTGDLDGYSNKLDTSNLTSSTNNGEIRAGLGAPVVINLPDSSSFSGEVTAQDFSLEARQLQTGGTLKYNGTGVFRENIVATSTTLKVTNQPVPNYGESASNATYSCYVGRDGVNYGVNPESKEIQGFTATVGQTYCVMYFIEVASAKELTIPTTFSPSVERVMIRMAVYSANGSNASNSSFAGFLYVHIPRAQFIGGDGGVNGNQTSNATTAWTFSALSYDRQDATCAECALDNSVLGYMVYVPCGDVAQNVTSLVIIGGGVAVTTTGTNKTKQLPVFYVMDNNQLVTPQYSDLTYTSATPATASVSNTGVVTGAAVGNTTITVAIASRPEITATATVNVTTAG